MKQLVINRVAYTDAGTVGSVRVGDSELRTLELPWRQNMPRISCIPLGTYICKIRYSPRFKKHLYEVTGVPNRSAVLIHAANWAGDAAKGYKCELQGCISFGLSSSNVGQLMNVNSRAAIKRFMDYMNGEDFELIITGAKA